MENYAKILGNDRGNLIEKDPNLSYIYLGYFVCVSVCHNCGTLCYSFSFSNQTDQEDETAGLKREGLKMER
jgi:hypothetical protein